MSSSRSRSHSNISVQRSTEGHSPSIPKLKNKLEPGLDYGVELLANNAKHTTPPNTPIVKRSLNLDELDPRAKTLVNSDKSHRQSSRPVIQPSSIGNKSFRGDKPNLLQRLKTKDINMNESPKLDLDHISNGSRHSNRSREHSNNRSREQSQGEMRSREQSQEVSRRETEEELHNSNRMPSFHDSDLPNSYREEEQHGSRSHDDEDDRRPMLDSEFADEIKEPEPEKPTLSPQEIMKKKRKMLLHIRIMAGQGYEPYTQVGITNTIEEIEEVEEDQKARRSLANGIEFAKKLLVGATYGIEWLNHRYNPVDAHLDGWSEQIYEDRDEYNEVLEELYTKYSGEGHMMPELKLLMMLGGSALMFHFSKSLMSSGNVDIPNFEKIMNKHPELKRAYEQAAMNEMQQANLATNIGKGQEGPPTNMMNYVLGSLTGDQNTGNAINTFMNNGGNNPPAPPRPNRFVPPNQMQNEVQILPPSDPDHVLGNSPPNSPQRTTRNNRDRI